jgi:hypothetical protein
MLNLMRNRKVSGIITWITLYSFLLMMSGCYYFKVTRPTENTRTAITRLQSMNKNIYLHLNEKVWSMTGISVLSDTVSGKISETTAQYRTRTVKPTGANRYKKYGTDNEQYLLNEVHIFTSGFGQSPDGKVSFPVTAISKIEVYDPDTGATVATWIFGIAGTAAAAFGVLLIIALLTKSSCPFVYTWDGKDFVFNGEIFSGATQPGLERDDYLRLKGPAPVENSYRIKLTNEVHEIQSVNLARLRVVDHPKGTDVLIDKYGNIQTYKTPAAPVSAANRNGRDILPLISIKDTVSYIGDEKNILPDGIEELTLKFIKPDGCTSSKLLLRAKNSFWLDGLFSRFHSMFGSHYNKFSEKQAATPGAKLSKFLLDQDIPLSVFLKQGDDWKLKDYFNIAGPMALRDDILPIDLKGIKSDTVEVKLRTGFMFWEIDYAAMDFSSNEQVKSIEAEPLTVTDKTGADRLGLVRSKDKDYCVLREPGDEITLTYPIPSLQDSERTVFLHTSGYYKILRELKGKADRKKLETFRNPGRFPVFSKEEYENLIKNK